MKKASYYKVHLNKRPKAKLSNSKMKQTMLFIGKITEFVNAARECAIALKMTKKLIPDYAKGGQNLAIVGDNKKPESILKGVSAIELEQKSRLFTEKMSNILTQQNSIFNNKPAN